MYAVVLHVHIIRVPVCTYVQKYGHKHVTNTVLSPKEVVDRESWSPSREKRQTHDDSHACVYYKTHGNSGYIYLAVKL